MYSDQYKINRFIQLNASVLVLFCFFGGKRGGGGSFILSHLYYGASLFNVHTPSERARAYWMKCFFQIILYCCRPRKREMTCTASSSRQFMRYSRRAASRICCWRRSCLPWLTRWRRRKLSSMKFCQLPTLTPLPSLLSRENSRWDCGPLIVYLWRFFLLLFFLSFFVGALIYLLLYYFILCIFYCYRSH